MGKATIYRRWPGKEDLLLDAIAALQAPLPEPAGRSAREDLVTVLGAMRDSVADPRRAREFALLLGEGAKYPRLMARYVETMLEPRREVIRSVLRRGVATGELRASTDIDAALFMLTGAVLARGKYDVQHAARVRGAGRGRAAAWPGPAVERIHDHTGRRGRPAAAGRAAAGGPVAVRAPAEGTAEVAGRLLAIQAQDPRGARLAVRARSRAHRPPTSTPPSPRTAPSW